MARLMFELTIWIWDWRKLKINLTFPWGSRLHNLVQHDEFVGSNRILVSVLAPLFVGNWMDIERTLFSFMIHFIKMQSTLHNAGCQEVSRCRTRGESEGIHCMQVTKQSSLPDLPDLVEFVIEKTSNVPWILAVIYLDLVSGHIQLK